MNELIKKVGQMLCIGFEGQECGPELRSLLKEVRPGGVIFFQRNIATEEQFRKLVADIREVLEDSRPFLAIDQEGGEVDRFRELLGPLPSARDAAQAGLAFELGDLAGRELAAFGLNVDFAPVLDLGSPESRSVLGTRAAGDKPQEVIQFAREFLRGLGGWNIMGCAKHFPGLGAGQKDSHLEMPMIEKSAGALLEEDLLPFRTLAMQSQLMPMIMVAHAWYPELQKALSVEGEPLAEPLPASLSHNLVTRLLRKHMGYEGLIVCDDLEMGGVLQGHCIEEAAVAAVRAGCGLLLVCRHASNVQRVHRALVREAERDSGFLGLMKLTRRPEIPPSSFSVQSLDLEALRRDIQRVGEDVSFLLAKLAEANGGV